MSFVTDYLTPLIIMLFMIGIIIMIIYWVRKGFLSICPHPSLTLKYKFMKTWDEGKVKMCYFFIDQKKDVSKMKKALLIEGMSVKDVDEMAYLYNLILDKVIKESKGGNKK